MKALLLMMLTAALCVAQGFEAAGNIGYGRQHGDDQMSTNSVAVGGTFGWQSRAKSGLVFDYFYAPIPNRLYSRHWVTGSYRVQRRDGKVRPFFQAGAGTVIDHVDIPGSVTPSGRGFEEYDPSFSILFAGGATVHVTESFFLRPHLRSYWYVGPTHFLVPTIAAGFRF